MKYEVEGKTALVTGASRGLGEQISLELVKKGAFVIGTSRSGPPESLKPFIENNQAAYIPADLSEDGERLIKEVYEKYNGFEILVNNAGALSVDYFPLVEREKIVQEMRLDLLVPMLLHHDWINYFRQAQGNVRTPELSVNICSISSFYAWSGGAEYQASKTGLAAFIFGLRAMQNNFKVADEEVKSKLGNLKDLGIRFLNIYPDSIDTGMINKAEAASLYKVRGDFLPQDLVIKTIVDGIKGEGKFGQFDDLAILTAEDGINLAFIPKDPETQRADFAKRELEKIADVSSLIRRT